MAQQGEAGARRRWINRVGLRGLPVLILVVAVLAVPLLIFSDAGMPRLDSVERELHMVEAETQQLRRETDLLRARVKRLRDDPTTVEQVARDELGLIRQSEVVFQFPRARR